MTSLNLAGDPVLTVEETGVVLLIRLGEFVEDFLYPERVEEWEMDPHEPSFVWTRPRETSRKILEGQGTGSSIWSDERFHGFPASE
jgi:hypothetical protein